jgi:hypothetical protein
MDERISKIVNHPLRVPILIGIGALGVGLGVGYIFGRKAIKEVIENEEQLKLEFNLEEALAEVIDTSYEPEDKPPRVIIDAEALKRSDKGADFVVDRIETVSIEPALDIDDEGVKQNVFANNSDDGWDYERELKHRNESEPYVIHKDEFYADEKGYTQITLTYYSGDNIMVDEEDAPVYNHETIVGTLKFGHGSADPNVFYVRNDKRHAEYEILYDKGLFSQEVLGLEIENNERVHDLKHANVPKFKLD